MNPFDKNKTVHNTWPIILTMYNIPTWLCHKRKYLMLSILIQGLKQASIDIDVFMEPLMEDMVNLLNDGVYIWDQYQQEYFMLKTIIFVCIHDVPWCFIVSGKTKGKDGCPVYVDVTASVNLPSSEKLVFMQHRQFLEGRYMYHKIKRHFDNTVEKIVPRNNIVGVFLHWQERGLSRSCIPIPR
jgi:hypothetical protein